VTDAPAQLDSAACQLFSFGQKNGATDALTDWIRVRGDASGALFMPFDLQGRALPEKRMSSQAVYWLVDRRATDAGIPRLAPHDTRRSFISNALDVIGDLSIVTSLAGHASANTTRRYDLRDEHARAKAAREIHVPVHG
jgi:integrase